MGELGTEGNGCCSSLVVLLERSFSRSARWGMSMCVARIMLRSHHAEVAALQERASC